MRACPCCLAIAAAVAATPSSAQTAAAAPPACSTAEHRQFDFWLGRWEVFGPDGRKAGDNRIEAIHGGCALLERWSGRGGFSGSSLNSWDAAARQWRQHWVDSQGGLLRLAGGRDGEGMVLRGSEPHESRPDARVEHRIAWTPQADGTVRQRWERSDDAGATWSVVFDGHYVRAAN